MACVFLTAAPGAGAAPTRYSLVHGCYALKSQAIGKYVVRAANGGYEASAPGLAQAEGFRMQATDLGRYLLYTRARAFLSAESSPLSPPVDAAAGPSETGNWVVTESGSGFRLTLPDQNRALAASGPGGALRLGDPSDAAGLFTFEEAQGCPAYPEIELNATGTPGKGPNFYAESRGLIDAHMHMMAYEFLGGRAHCGRPWHAYGAPYALADCPDHYPNGAGAVLENGLAGGTRPTHDPVGWPTFKDWPDHDSLTHENSYYRWLERAWMGGLRVYVNLFVENTVLCQVYPLKQNSCNEMDSVRLQARRIRELERYIDAQEGGPGKGWFRIVTDPFEARRVVNEGKLAVVLGIEVSKLFDCGVVNDVPQCDEPQIDRSLDQVYKLGVRQMELVNKFDNALGGVAGDGGTTGVIVNTANRLDTGNFWRLQTCTGKYSDHAQLTLPGMERDSLLGNGLQAFLPAGATPIYPAAPHCNTRGLSTLGEHVVSRMMDKRMIVDPDHLDVIARQHLLSMLEARRYSGVISSHSWSTEDAYPRIYKLGGVVTPYAGNSTSFVKAWKTLREERDPRFYFGFGYGADMNGFGGQGGPRTGATNPVKYPFKSFDGKVTLDRQHSGERVYDINVDGVDHYGLYPDWIEDLRQIAGNQIIDDMSRGAEAYLQMWERADGIPANYCRTGTGTLTRSALGKLRLSDAPQALLRRAGQPNSRAGQVWRWCVGNARKPGGEDVAVFTSGARVGLIASTAARHRVAGIGKGAKASRLRAKATPFGTGVLRGKPARNGARFVYGVRKGRVTFVAAASRSVASSRSRLRAYLKLARLR